MKVAELKDKSADELAKSLIQLREQQFKLRMQKATGQLSQTHLLKDNKQSIARVKTILAQKKAGK